jgi:chaperonin GroES
MAGAANRLADAIELSGEEVTAVAPKGLTLTEILKPGVNLAEHLDANEVTKIGNNVIRDVEIDERSRGKGTGEKGTDGDWLARYRKWLDMAMQVRDAKNFPWPRASNVKFPLLTTAAVQFQARAYPAIVDGTNLVKGRVLGPDPDGTKAARAERIGQHMTWQLLFRMAGWEEETDRLLLMLPITGCVFRKTYYDSIANANCSEMVSGEDFIINYWAKSLETAPRYTHVLRYYPYEVQEKIAAGIWLPVRVDHDDADSGDEDALVEFYEQHRTMDLDGDGYPEPYVVTTTKQGEVARIVPCFGADEVTVKVRPGILASDTIKLKKLVEANALHLADKVVRIERRQYFTKYGFIPAPDGSFYDIGFGALLEDITATIDTTLNQMLDAGALQNAQGGFLGSGVNIRGGTMPVRLGEWKRVDVTGGTLRENIVPFATPGPSPVLFQLLEMLIGAAKEITSVQDVMTGEGQANQPATTTLALIEQGHKVMTSIFKRIHRAFGQELRILRRLNRDYLDEEEYFQLNDSAPQQGQQQTGPDGQPLPQQPQQPQKIGRQDYADEDLDVIPVSDPQMASDMHKMARAQALLQFNGDILVNQQEIRSRYFEALGERDIKKLLTVPKPQPDPKILIEGMKESRAKVEGAAKVRSQDAIAANNLATAAATLEAIGLTADAAALAEAATETGSDLSHDNPDGGGFSGVEGQPSDPGISPVPQGPAIGPDSSMGGGQVPDAGTPGPSGPVGPVSGDSLA